MARVEVGERSPNVSPGELTMREARSATAQEWDSLVERAPGGGHIYQSWAWGDFKRRLGWKPVRLVMERDGEVVGAGQFLVRRTVPVPGKLMYAPKGPWLEWEDEAAVRVYLAGVRKVARREGVHTVKIEPEVLESRVEVKEQLREEGYREARWDLQFKTTMVMDLSQSEAELLGGMKEKTRYNVRLAGRKGVTVVEDNSLSARDQLYDLLVATAVRDGFTPRRHDYYQAVWQAMYEAGRAHLFFAEHEGERLAAMLVYTFGSKYWYKTGASSNEKRNVMPTYLLQWEVMRWAQSQGITCYDMYAVLSPDKLNEKHPKYGLYRFKSGFGGEIAEFVGCLDLPVRKLRAAAWYKFEPSYLRVYRKLKHDTYY